jgi:hypothetical protein
MLLCIACVHNPNNDESVSADTKKKEIHHSIILLLKCKFQLKEALDNTDIPLQEDPFSLPSKPALHNCGPELRYKYDTEKISDKNGFHNLLNTIMEINILNMTEQDIKNVMPIDQAIASTLKNIFSNGSSLTEQIDKSAVVLVGDKKIIKIHAQLRGPACYKDIIASDDGEVSVYGCCGI